MLWLALVLPALPLQLATRALEGAGALQAGHALPVVVIDGPPQRPLVTCGNAAARAAGIAPGMKLAAAQALAGGLIHVAHDAQRMADALHELACWGYQFSAAVAPRTQGVAGGLLLEIGGSLRLFGGRHLLIRRLQSELTGLGYRAQPGFAPTPQAAWLIALARTQRVDARDALSADELAAALDPLPLSLAGWDEATRDALRGLGLHALGELRALPRAGLRKRFAAALIDLLDRAYGRVPDPQPPFEPPARFVAGVELPADLADAERLMVPAQRLLYSLEGFLRGRGAGTTELVFSAQHNPRRAQPVSPTVIPLRLAAPERDAQRLAKLLAERLTRMQLPEPAIALRLAVERLQPFDARNASLLPPAPGEAGLTADRDWLHLAETLHARLGSERVFQLQAIDDHRPEHAAQRVPLATGMEADGARRSPAVAGGAAAAPAAADAEHDGAHAGHAPPPRPLLLLDVPAPLAAHDAGAPAYHGALTLIAGPERIESGWWDLGRGHRPVHRDYFVARNPRGQLLWVFRELAAPHRWFLHGFFA